MTLEQPALLQQPAATTYRLADLVRLVSAGQVRVPHFQRDFRWSGADVLKLLDSIHRGFPVGSVLLWKRSVAAPETMLGALAIPASDARDAMWVVDGQQRVTSLVNAVNQQAYKTDPRFALDYSLLEHKIVRHVEATANSAVPLPTIFDLRSLLSWVQTHPEASNAVEELNDVNVRLREFALPASVVEDPDEDVLREIFDRMNNAGKRLRRAEVFSALYAPPEGETGRALTIGQIAVEIDASGTFGRIDDDTVLRALLARRGPNITRDVNSEFDADRSSVDMPGETEPEAYEKALEALQRAISFLQKVAGVPHFSFLPYRYLLVTLVRFFALFPEPEARNVELLARWFWQAALRGPEIFRGSATGAMRGSCTVIKKGEESISVQGLMKSVAKDYPLSLPSTTNFRTNIASARVVLCALWSLRPRSLSSGAPLTVETLAGVLDASVSAAPLALEVIPRRRVPSSRTASAANRIIQPVEDVDVQRVLAGDPPLGWEEDASIEDVLSSHLVTLEASRALARENVEEFLRLRDEALTACLKDFVEERSGVNYESTPPLSDLNLDDIDLRDDLAEGIVDGSS